MIVLTLTHDEAVILRTCCYEPNIRRKIERALQTDLLPECEGEGRDVWLRDGGDGLEVVAVCYDSAEAADTAWERWWAQRMGEAVRVGLPVVKKRGRTVRP